MVCYCTFDICTRTFLILARVHNFFFVYLSFISIIRWNVHQPMARMCHWESHRRHNLNLEIELRDRLLDHETKSELVQLYVGWTSMFSCCCCFFVCAVVYSLLPLCCFRSCAPFFGVCVCIPFFFWSTSRTEFVRKSCLLLTHIEILKWCKYARKFTL